ncbi:hypothetical protein POG22_21475 [Geitlerinema sp. CS-897]|nr:hypothetical protein [Geitlerinema sp. CS-897]
MTSHRIGGIFLWQSWHEFRGVLRQHERTPNAVLYRQWRSRPRNRLLESVRLY